MTHVFRKTNIRIPPLRGARGVSLEIVAECKFESERIDDSACFEEHPPSPPQGGNIQRTLTLVALIYVSLAWLSPSFAQQPQTALCVVCQVNEGRTEPEKVVASSTYKNKTYYFCSKGCKNTFDRDPEAYVPPVFPRPAPSFTVQSLAGENVTLEKFRGKVVLLDFWATWCKPCLKSMPALQQLHDRYAAQGLVIMGVSTDANGAKPVRSFIEKNKITYPIFLDNTDELAADVYKIKVLPMLFLIDRNGQIVQQWLGEANVQELERAIVAHLD